MYACWCHGVWSGLRGVCRLYDFHPDGQEDLLIDTMKMLKYTGDPWEDVFKEEVRKCCEGLDGPLLTILWRLVLPEDGCGEPPEPFPCLDLARRQHG